MLVLCVVIHIRTHTHTVKGYPVIDGVVYANNLTFARFFETSCNYGTYAIGNNPLSPDAVHPMHMADTAKFNVEKSSLAFFYEPDVAWINQEVWVSGRRRGLVGGSE